MTPEEFKVFNQIEDILLSRGIQVRGSSAKCPLHEDKSASLSVDVNKQLWNCHAGCGGGDAIELAAKLEGMSAGQFMKSKGITTNPEWGKAKGRAPAPKAPDVKHTIETVYQYQDANGKNVFQVVRMKPKTFRQRHQGSDGAWVWGMEGIERVLYRLPSVIASETVAIAEGERDSDTLTRLGYCGTCNVGGAGKWLDGYTESLAGKHLVIFGDNDDAGKKHVELVLESVAGHVKSARIVEVPKPHKDISDFVKAQPDETAKAAVDALILASQQLFGGFKLPVYSMAEIEPLYAQMVRNSSEHSLNLGNWLPSFHRLRPLVPGDLSMFVGNTGIGKTALLSSLALKAKPLPTLMFQLELPPELMFERFVSSTTNMDGREVESAYKDHEDQLGEHALNHHFGHLLICCEPRKTVEQIETIIMRSELKFGVKPKLVLIDYVQLVGGKGQSRYDKASMIAEDLKAMAKATKTIVIIASQVGRPGDTDNPEIGLHDAKESGSLENSSGLVVGCWRDPDDPTLMILRVLKATRGGAGIDVHCNFDGRKMTITERGKDPHS